SIDWLTHRLGSLGRMPQEFAVLGLAGRHSSMLDRRPSHADRECSLTRRAFVRTATAGAMGLSLGDLFSFHAAARDPSPRARAVILLWLWGGPSHLDTFDMKPDAPIEYRGPFEPISTVVPGIRVCELLPELARRTDKFALLRTMHHESNDHGIAGTIA